MRWLVILSLILLPSCAWRWAIAEDGMCIGGELLDIRIGMKTCDAGSVSTHKEGEAVSERGAELIEKSVEAAVRAALACAGIGAAGMRACV